MGPRRESIYHQDLIDFLTGEQWSRQDIEELESHAHGVIGMNDERLGELTRFTILKAHQVAERVAEAGWTPDGQYVHPMLERTQIAQADFDRRTQ